MKPISFRDTLVYHDGVEVFGAQDSIEFDILAHCSVEE